MWNNKGIDCKWYLNLNKGKISQVTDNVNNIPLEITDYIDCPGNEGI